MTGRRVLFVCDFDSQIFGALPAARTFEARGWAVRFVVPSLAAIPQAARAAAQGFEIVEREIMALAVGGEAFGYDAIGVSLTGSGIALFRQALALAARATGRRRPALFCGFNGLVFEKFEEGLAWRLGYDVISLNGPRDRDAFEDFLHASAFAEQPCVITGLTRRADIPPRSPKPAGARKTFVFAEQVVVPRLESEREALVATLARLAQASPGWDVVLKARVRRGEQTFHFQRGHVADLVDALRPRPRNLAVSHEPLDGLLARADLFATVSSTALFDAFDHGVPSLVASDFGLRNADGAHVFFSSGLLTNLRDLRSLDDAPALRPDPRWLDRTGYGPDHAPDALVDWLEAFDPSRAFPPAHVSAAEALRAAANSNTFRRKAEAAWREVEEALARDDAAAAHAALPRLGEALAAATVWLEEGWGDDALAAVARRLNVYRLYKRLSARLGRPLPD